MQSGEAARDRRAAARSRKAMASFSRRIHTLRRRILWDKSITAGPDRQKDAL